MGEILPDLDERLERAIKEHLSYYVREYDRLPADVRAKKSLLRARVDNNDKRSPKLIDRDLLGDYLSLRVQESTNRLQETSNQMQQSNNKLEESNYKLQLFVGILAAASVISAIAQAYIAYLAYIVK